MAFELKRRQPCGICGIDGEKAKMDSRKARVHDDHWEHWHRAMKIVEASPRSYVGMSWVEALVCEAERLAEKLEEK